MSTEISQFMLEDASLDAGGASGLSAHLRDAEFCELLTLSVANAESHPHLLSCADCAAELAAMRSSLGVFRDASRAYADTEMRRLRAMELPSRGLMISPAMRPAWWLTAAALMFAALAPVQMQRTRVSHDSAAMTGNIATTSSTQSDEALMEDVDRDASASLPSSLQALADPSTLLDVSTSTATQRKD